MCTCVCVCGRATLPVTEPVTDVRPKVTAAAAAADTVRNSFGLRATTMLAVCWYY